MSAFRHAKKTRKRTKDFERSKKAISKKRKAKKGRFGKGLHLSNVVIFKLYLESRSKECNLLAIQSIYDPQEFADRLFRMLESKKIDKYEVSLICYLFDRLFLLL